MHGSANHAETSNTNSTQCVIKERKMAGHEVEKVFWGGCGDGHDHDTLFTYIKLSKNK